jgi:hypothetical protein
MIVAHSFEKRREGAMRRASIVLVLGLAAGSALAQSKEPILLREMGSFHIGGRVIEITGQPIKEVVFTPGGVPAKMDPNGKYQVEQMYVQYFLPQNRKGKVPLLLWHGGGLTGVTYETKPDGGEPTLGGDRNKVQSIKTTPILVLYGDNAKDHPRWSKIRQGGIDYAGVFKAAGGSIDVVDLPDAGLKGNSHMVMMDKNSDQVAELIQKWLVGKGLAE